MKKIQLLLWLVGLLVGSSNIAMAQNNESEKEEQPDSTLKVNASVEVRGAYDCKNYYAAPSFGAATIPMKPEENKRKQLLFDVSRVKLSIEKELALAGEGITKLVLKANMKKDVKLESGYAEFKGFRIGKATTNFCGTDDCGLVFGDLVQIRWQHELHPLIHYTLAIEEAPDFVIFPEIKKEERDKEDIQPKKNMPALSASVKYEKEKLWHVQLSGLFRVLEYYNKTSNMDFYIPTWGINIGTAVHLVPEQTVLKLQGVYGQGIGSYMTDLADLEDEANTVYTVDRGKSSRKTVDAWVAGINVEHKWLPKLCSELAYQIVATVDNERAEDAYKHGHTASVNLFYHPTKQVKVGAEYLLSTRQNISKDWKDAHRIQAVVGFEL